MMPLHILIVHLFQLGGDIEVGRRVRFRCDLSSRRMQLKIRRVCSQLSQKGRGTRRAAATAATGGGR